MRIIPISENVNRFLKKFNRAATINGWTEIKKSLYIVVYLEDAVLTFYENVQDIHNYDIKCPELEKKFRLEFELLAQTDMIRLMLE